MNVKPVCLCVAATTKEFIQMLKPTELSGHEFNSHSEPALYSYSNFIFCSVSDFILVIAFVSCHVYLIKFLKR